VKLSDIEFIKLLPQFMRNDAAVQGLAAGIDSIIPQLAADLEKLSTWDRIDDLSEAELDELAWELNILWYDTSAPIDVKRNLVQGSDAVYKKLGTKWAVENVINTYFGDGYIEEWFEYGGDPGHFRIYSTNPTVNESKFAEFLSLLNKVKRASAKLDGVFITLTGQMNMSAGTALHEIGAEQYDIGAGALV
jgi:phage tail P2-like protein